MRAENRKNIECAIPLFHHNTLGIEKVLRNVTRTSKATYDINAIMHLLVLERILEPGSKRAAHANKGKCFFKSYFTEDDIFRALDVFAKAKKNITGAMNRKLESSRRRDVHHVFYDVTNYYFEIDEEDEFRRHGVEKNKRPDPIVQMGLLQDANTNPHGFEIFSGNTTDWMTLLPVLKELEGELGLEHVIVIADKGINASDNVACCTLGKNGFVFSQSICGTESKAKLR